jgi:hypothetical protein
MHGDALGIIGAPLRAPSRTISWASCMSLRAQMVSWHAEWNAEALIVERLQQVVDGGDVEGVHGMLGMGSREDHVGWPFEVLEHAEPVALRHAHVEQQQLGFQLANRTACFGAATRFTNQRDLRISLEERSQLPPGEGLVIRDECPDWLGHTPPPRAVCAMSPTNDRSPPAGQCEALRAI